MKSPHALTEPRMVAPDTCAIVTGPFCVSSMGAPHLGESVTRSSWKLAPQAENSQSQKIRYDLRLDISTVRWCSNVRRIITTSSPAAMLRVLEYARFRSLSETSLSRNKLRLHSRTLPARLMPPQPPRGAIASIQLGQPLYRSPLWHPRC